MVPFAVERQHPSAPRASSCAVSSTWPRVRASKKSSGAPRPSNPATLVLDLRDVTFFDSTGLQLVLDADVRAREEGRRFIVLPGDGEPRRILELAEVADRLQLEE